MTWSGNVTFAALNFVIAELLRRLFKCIIEHRRYHKHYQLNNRLGIIFNYGFKFSSLSCVLLIIIAAILLNQFNLPQILNGIVAQSHLIPLWWIFHSVGFSESYLTYANQIRSNTGLDYASGIANCYFHGYLNLALPAYNGRKGICKRIEEYESDHHVRFAIKRLIILIPKSMHTKPVIQSPLMERQDKQPLEEITIDRSGVSRTYSNDVYRLLIDGRPFYIAVEGATPLLTLFDSLNFQPTNTKEMEFMQREILLKFYRCLKRTSEKWPGTQGQCEFIFYDDYRIDGQPQDVGEVLCAQIKEIWKTRGEHPDSNEIYFPCPLNSN